MSICRNEKGDTAALEAELDKDASRINELSVYQFMPDGRHPKGTVLTVACEFSKFDVVRTLLHRGANVKIKDYLNRSALYYACGFKDGGKLRYFIHLFDSN